jgi:hypothetical protein
MASSPRIERNEMSIKQAIEALELALPFMEEQATIQGYGFYRPANPHNFFPDPESCTEAEIENHRAACEAYDEGKFVPDTSGGWVSPWGIGSYTDTIPEIQAQCDKARAALAALRSMPQGEPVATIRYERGTPGKENDMPKVVSCNWLPDGVYSVYATPHTEAVQPDRSEKIPLLIPSNPRELPTEAVRMSEAERRDLTIAAFAIATRNDETAVLHEADAERIVELLVRLSGLDVDALVPPIERTGLRLAGEKL